MKMNGRLIRTMIYGRLYNHSRTGAPDGDGALRGGAKAC